MAGSYLGDTWIEDGTYSIGLDGATLLNPAPPSAPPSGGEMTPEQQAAYTAKFGSPFAADMGHVVNYGEGVTGYEGGRYLGNSQYGPTITDERNGNLVWSGQDWVPVPDASGSLFGDFITPIALFAALAAGGGALAGLGEAGAAGAAGAGAGAAGEAAALGSLGSGLTGVAVPGIGLTAPAGMGALGTGLAGTTAAEIGLGSALAGAGAVGSALYPAAVDMGVTGSGAYPWLDAAGNLDVDAFLQATAPGGEYAGAIPGGAEGIAGMDTLGSTSWLESAANSLAHGDTSWLTQNITPSQVKSVISKLTGGSTATPRTGTRTGTAAAGALGGILPIMADSGSSGIESVLAANADARKSADAFAQAMAQSGKGV